MAKHKKKHSKKEDVADDLLGVAALSIKKYRKVTNEIAKLSTGQKLLGSVVLLAAGYFYLDKVTSDEGPEALLPGLGLLLPKPAKRHAALAPAGEKDAEEMPVEPRSARKSHKKARPGKAPGTFGRKPAASPDDL